MSHEDDSDYTRREILRVAGSGVGAYLGLDHGINIGARFVVNDSVFPEASVPYEEALETVRAGNELDIGVYEFSADGYGPDVFEETIAAVQEDLNEINVSVSYRCVSEDVAGETIEAMEFQTPERRGAFLDAVEQLSDEDIAVWMADFDTQYGGVSMARGDVLVDRSGSAMYDANMANHEIGHELGLEHTTYAYDTMSYAPSRKAAAYLGPVPYSFESHQNWTTTLDS